MHDDIDQTHFPDCVGDRSKYLKPESNTLPNMCIYLIHFKCNQGSLNTVNADCTAPGYSCNDCFNTKTCIMINGELLESIEACPSGTSCQESTGVCVGSGTYECSPGDLAPFKCPSIGIYPNPFNCRSYYMCSFETERDISSVEILCPNGWAFDPFTGRCSKKIENPPKCDGLVPICSSEGERGQIKGSTGFYYQCVKSNEGDYIVPEIRACAFNYYFNGTNCINPTPTVVDSQGRCVAKGNFYFPGDCQKYRDCGSIGAVPTVRPCASAYRFDPIEQKCVHFTCSNYYLFN